MNVIRPRCRSANLRGAPANVVGRVTEGIAPSATTVSRLGSREEHAGTIRLNAASRTDPHRLLGRLHRARSHLQRPEHVETPRYQRLDISLEQRSRSCPASATSADFPLREGVSAQAAGARRVRDVDVPDDDVIEAEDERQRVRGIVLGGVTRASPVAVRPQILVEIAHRADRR